MTLLFRLRQLLGIGGVFLAYALGVVFDSLLLFPWQRLRCRDPWQRQLLARRSVHRQFRLMLRFLDAAGIVEVSVHDPAGRLADPGGCLIVSNHPSLLDIVILFSLVPEADCIVKRAHWRNPLVAPILRATGYLANDDAEAFLAGAATCLARGIPLILFPEGSRSPAAGLLPFHRSAASLALRQACQILPLRLECQPRALAKDQSWLQLPPTRLRFRVEVLEPVTPARDADPGAAQRLTRQLEALISTRS